MLKIKISEKFFTELAILITILSFIPEERTARILTLVMYGMWGIVALWKVSHERFYFSSYSKLMIAFYVYWFAMTYLLFFTEDYHTTNMGVVNYFKFCIVFYILGYNYTVRNKDGYMGLLRAFIIGVTGLVIAMVPAMAFLRTAFYMFKQKNEMGQLIAAAISLELFVIAYYYRGRTVRMLMYGIGGFSFVMLMVVHSRTPLVAALAIFVLSFLEKKDKSVRDYITFVGIIFTGILAIYFQGGMDYFTELFAPSKGVTGSALNTVTSGRMKYYTQALDDFFRHPLWGRGGLAYVDNFVLNSLRSGGLALTIPMVPLVYLRLWKNYDMARKYMRSSGEDDGAALLFASVEYLSVFYFLVSLMEAYPPFGPNTAVFFLWFITGLADRVWEKGELGKSPVRERENMAVEAST